MYSDQDLDSAVGAGVLSAETARALQEHVAARGTPAGVAERFLLVRSFNDVVVFFAGVLLLSATGWIAREWIDVDEIEALLLMGLAWGLAEVFTRWRRMALPSVAFLLVFVGSAFWLGTDLLMVDEANCEQKPFRFCQTGDFQLIAGSLLAVAAATAHWWRFRVPIAVAAGAAGLVGAVVFTLAEINHAWTMEWIRSLTLLAGFAAFAWAMRWDTADPTRQTSSSDVAFWLHLLAALLIVGALYEWAEGLPGEAGIAAGIYVLMGVAALVIDRRILLLFGLLYVANAFSNWIESWPMWDWPRHVDSALALFPFCVALLALLVFWQPLRALMVARLPAVWRERLPPA